MYSTGVLALSAAHQALLLAAARWHILYSGCNCPQARLCDTKVFFCNMGCCSAAAELTYSTRLSFFDKADLHICQHVCS